MRKSLVSLLCLALSAPLIAQVTAIKAGKMVDPKTGSVLANQTILVENGRIKSVGANTAVPRDATVIDLSNYTVLPGLIDCHTHVLLQPEDEGAVPPVITKSQAFRTVQGVAAAKKNLEAGFTTMRDVDSEGAGFADVAVRDGINKGIIPGPRLFVSTYALTITGGHMNLSGMNPDLNLPDPAAITNTREEMVNEVRREVKYGADWIKLYATGTLRHVNPVTLESLSQVSVEDVQAVVNEAKRWGKDVAAHAYGGDGATNSILGGVRTLEHGMLMTEENIQLLAKHGTYWCPTLSVYFPHDPADLNDFRKRILQSHKEVFQKAMRAGVKIAFGTDVGAFEHGTGAQEFLRMVEYGMKPIDAIRSATVTASELLRMENHIGTIESGKLADIIAVQGNPVEDIKALTDVVFVMKEGTVYKTTGK